MLPRPRAVDVPQDRRTGMRMGLDPRLLAFAGAVLLMCAPVFPGLSRLVVLPALLLAPGYAFLRLPGKAAGPRSISVAVPVSIVLVVCASLILDITGIRLGPFSLGLLLGGVTGLLLACSYWREMDAELHGQNHAGRLGDDELGRSDASPSEQG